MSTNEQIKQFAAEIAEKLLEKGRKSGYYTANSIFADAARQMIIHKLIKEGWTKV